MGPVTLESRYSARFSRIPPVLRNRWLHRRRPGEGWQLHSPGEGARQRRGFVLHRRRPEIETVLIAMPSATGTEMTSILKLCRDAGVSYKTVPGLAEIIEGKRAGRADSRCRRRRPAGAQPVHLEEGQIRGSLQGKVVLVTGAAGSIGSELLPGRSRASTRPGSSASKSPNRRCSKSTAEMRQTFPQVPLHPEIGSIQNRARLTKCCANTGRRSFIMPRPISTSP